MEALRRKFLLSSDDMEYLDNAFPEWEAIDGRWILLRNFPIRPGFTVQSVTAAIQIPSGYPQTRLDMVYFHPAVLRADGQPIGATGCTVPIDGKPFQRWSRHYRLGEWQPNEDNIATHVMAIRDWLDRAAPIEVNV